MSFLSEEYLATKRKWKSHDVRVIKQILRGPEEKEMLEREQEHGFWSIVFFGCMIIAAAIILIAGCQTAHAQETDEQIVQAIYKAEGGEKTKYPYGIRSVRCESTQECKKVCLNTVKNNRRRFAEYGHKKFGTFLEFLASRYSPVGASNDPTGLNVNWIHNVKYFLAKEVSK